MESFYLFIILFSSACGKIVLPDQSLHVSVEINKYPLVKEVTTPAPSSKEANDNEIDSNIAHSPDTTEPADIVSVEINKYPLINKVTTPAPSSKEANDNEIDSNIAHSPDTTEPADIDPSQSTVKPKVDNGTALILTPFIKEGRIAEARNACTVDKELLLGFESYSGFLTVNETYNSNTFFWYFPVVGKPVNETPWIVWLQGGPGASSLTGLFDEIGPVHYSKFGSLRKNPYTWLQNHSLLFIDNPVGTGYSFTDTPDGYVTDMETYSRHLHSAMRQFVQIFPELQHAPLFIAGESYAGKYVPALAMKIHKNRDTPGVYFNLTGLMLGNALIDPEVISHIAQPFQYFGMMDETQLQLMQPLITEFQDDIANNRSVAAKNNWVRIIMTLLTFTHQHHAYNFLRDELNAGEYTAFLQRSDVKRALHVGDIEFAFLNVTANQKLAPDFLSNTQPFMEELLEHYRALVYCGQLDQMLPCLYTSKNLRTWKWSGTEEYLKAMRQPYMINGRVAGYHKTGGRLTEAVFRGAGHMVPLDAPAAARALLAQWTAGALPATPPGVHILVDPALNDTVVNF